MFSLRNSKNLFNRFFQSRPEVLRRNSREPIVLLSQKLWGDSPTLRVPKPIEQLFKRHTIGIQLVCHFSLIFLDLLDWLSDLTRLSHFLSGINKGRARNSSLESHFNLGNQIPEAPFNGLITKESLTIGLTATSGPLALSGLRHLLARTAQSVILE